MTKCKRACAVRDRTGLEREQRDVVSLQQVSGSLRVEKDALQSKLRELQDVLTRHEQDCQQRATGESIAVVLQEAGAHYLHAFPVTSLTDTMLEGSARRKKIMALRKALAMYSSRLGLEFKQGQGE